MFFGNNIAASLRELTNEIKKYIFLQRDYLRLELITKATILLSAIAVSLILFVLGMMVLLYLSLTLAALMAAWIGSFTIAFAIVTALYTLLGCLVYRMRQRWIITPITNFIIRLFKEP